ncbi:MAG: DUF5615 family PIN-like protein [Bacteroidota bacterium]
MKFLADENVDGVLVSILREKAIEVLYVREVAKGIDDVAVLELANTENAILITEDKDFGELVYRLKMINRGIILIRLSGLESKEKGKYVSQIILQHSEKFRDAFSVIGVDKIRIRKMQQ